MRTLIAGLLLCFSFSSILAQENKPMRIEIEAQSESDAYHIIPFGHYGVLLFYKSYEIKSNEAVWYFTLYDTSFRETLTHQVKLDKDLNLKLYDKSNDRLYLFLQKKVNKKVKDDFALLTFDIHKGSSGILHGINPDHSDINAFRVAGNKACFAGVTVPSAGASVGQFFFSLTLVPLFSGYTLMKYKPSFFTFDLDNGNIHSVNIKLKGQAWAEYLDADTSSKSILLTIKNHIPRRKNSMYLNYYTYEGLLLDSILLNTHDSKRKLNTVKMAAVSDSQRYIIGTYNNKTSGYRANAANNAFNEGSNGFFISRLHHNQQEFIKFYNFSQLKNFYNAFNERNAVRLKKKAIRKAASGNEVSHDYQVLLHDIIIINNELIMIGELYYPEYHSVTYTSYDVYGRPVTSSYTVFDGYRYTNAIVAAFGLNGELLWDNTFEIWNIISNNIDEKVQVLFDGEDVVLTYSSEGEIASKIISGNQVVENKSYTKIQSNYIDDKLISDYNSDMEYWYGHYFITYGYQKIKNTSNDKRNRRTVFYFNKIAFQ
jgi:hypothetical protein